MKKLILFWCVSLVLVSMATFAFAQGRFSEPRVLSGDDVGFRVEGQDLSGKPSGTLMVRINGNWMEVGARMTPRPVK